MPALPNIAELNQQCRDFNEAHPVGSEVRYYPVIGGNDFRVRRVRATAYVLSGHTAVCFLEGESGCVALDACKPAA